MKKLYLGSLKALTSNLFYANICNNYNSLIIVDHVQKVGGRVRYQISNNVAVTIFRSQM